MKKTTYSSLGPHAQAAAVEVQFPATITEPLVAAIDRAAALLAALEKAPMEMAPLVDAIERVELAILAADRVATPKIEVHPPAPVITIHVPEQLAPTVNVEPATIHVERPAPGAVTIHAALPADIIWFLRIAGPLTALASTTALAIVVYWLVFWWRLEL